MPSVKDTVAELKRRLRAEMSQRRVSCASKARLQASERVSAALRQVPALKGAGVVAGYQAIRGEIDPLPALTTVQDAGGIVVWPRVAANSPRLVFHRACSLSAWTQGAFGIREPADTCPRMPAEAVDVFLVPGLAFDDQGRRLGWGGGFYDELARALPCRQRTVLVGIAHDFQMVARCPASHLDVSVDWVVTDQQVIRCPEQKPLTNYSS